MAYKISIVDDMYLDTEQRGRLESMGDVSIYEGVPSSSGQAIERIGNADIAILGWTNVTENMLNQMPNLKLISVWATGYDYVDVKAATQRRILITNVPGYAAQSVAEHAFALILALVRNLVKADTHVRSGKYSWQDFRGIELKGKTLGVIGTGAIGGQVVHLGKCFGMRVIAFTAHPSLERAEKLGVEYVELDDLLRQSDFLSLHLPLTPGTSRMLSSREFLLMKPQPS